MDRQVDPRRSRVTTRTTLFILLFLCLAGCGLLATPRTAQLPPADSLVVSFINVGQGDAILIQSGGKNYLIDGGRSEEGPNVVDFLRSRGVERLDGLVATHPDADHVGGLPDVLDGFDVATVYLSGDTKGTSTFNTFLRGVRDEGSQVVEARDGMRMNWGGTTVDVIAPPPGHLFEESNDNSVATLLTFGSARLLLAGDAESKEEEYMSNGSHTAPLTVLKVNHHGSNTSTTPLFLNRFKPEIAVIQVGADNSYGHPTPQTLERLRRTGAKIFRTDKDGDVIVTVKNNKVDVATTKGD